MFRVRLLCAAMVLAGVLAVTPTADAGDPCCCPPPPVKTTLCVCDPCTGCSTSVCVCVPACCCGETPQLVCCRKGAFGRKTLTYKWCNCGHTVDVLVKRNGSVKVR